MSILCVHLGAHPFHVTCSASRARSAPRWKDPLHLLSACSVPAIGVRTGQGGVSAAGAMDSLCFQQYTPMGLVRAPRGIPCKSSISQTVYPRTRPKRYVTVAYSDPGDAKHTETPQFSTIPWVQTALLMLFEEAEPRLEKKDTASRPPLYNLSSKMLLEMLLLMYPGCERVLPSLDSNSKESLEKEMDSFVGPLDKCGRPKEVFDDKPAPMSKRIAESFSSIRSRLFPGSNSSSAVSSALGKEPVLPKRKEEDALYYSVQLHFPQSLEQPLEALSENSSGEDDANTANAKLGPNGIDMHKAVARLVVAVADLLADAVVWEIFTRINGPWDVLDTLFGMLSAYATADLVSGFYNWLRLNFTPNSALFGWPFKAKETPGSDKKSFSRLVAPCCAAVAPIFALMLATPPGEIRSDAFICYFLTFLSLMPAFREWSGGSQCPPRLISLLQQAGIVIKRSSKSSFEKLEYCIICGLWDNLLTRVNFFSVLERWIYVHSGGRIRPRVWDVVPEARERACGPDDILCRKDR